MYPLLIFNNQVLIPMYNLMIGIGVILGLLFIENQIKTRNIKFEIDKKIYYSLIITLFFGYWGSKFLEMVHQYSNYNFQMLITSRINFYGGLIFGAISYFIVNKFLKIDNKEAFNILTPAYILGHGFGRLGCFFGGCCYGKPTDSFLGVTFPKGTIPIEHLGSSLKVHPVQLYEAFFLFLLFFVLVKFISFEIRTAVYFLSYSFYRFFIELLRGDDRGTLLIKYLSPSQTISILFFILALFLILKSKNKPRIEASA